jgi:ATP-dependent Clp protease ATP-binding subunit ClpX
MEAFLLETMFELPTLNGVQEVVVTGDVVEGKSRPLYTYSDKAEPQQKSVG